MELQTFMMILNDPHCFNYEKMTHKYKDQFTDFLADYQKYYTHSLPLNDFRNDPILYSDRFSPVSNVGIKQLLSRQEQAYNRRMAEEEIIATSAIEQIDLNRGSVRRILQGYAPADQSENRIFGLKQGLDLISDPTYNINAENLHRLYQTTVGNYLDKENQLKAGAFYRHEPVCIVSDRLEHTGIPAEKLPEAMSALFDFIGREDNINDLVKGAIIHFYFAYIHPYFDGNCRMARLLHLWFLLQKGYRSVLFLPFSYHIEQNRKAYYAAFTQIEKNYQISHHIDVTCFIQFCVEHIYNRIEPNTATMTNQQYEQLLQSGKLTKKESELWQFVIMRYGTAPFTTKQLEKDFGNAAYATIRGFVMKMTEEGLLICQKYKTRATYCVKQ